MPACPKLTTILPTQTHLQVIDGLPEYNAVRTIFLHSASGLGRRHYCRQTNDQKWAGCRVIQIERIENGRLEEQSQQRLVAVSSQLTEQGIQFEAGVHTRWLFHGTDSLDAIIANPIDGFSILMAGSGTGQLWGTGIYCARDAVYSNDYTTQRTAHGCKRMLLCLVTTGIACLGGTHLKLLPNRFMYSKYDSTVDSLSNPEIHIVNKALQVLPAYVITYSPP